MTPITYMQITTATAIKLKQRDRKKNYLSRSITVICDALPKLEQQDEKQVVLQGVARSWKVGGHREDKKEVAQRS